MTGLHELPNELILSIAESIESEHNLNSLCRTNRHLYQLLDPYLYLNNVNNHGSFALLWAANKGHVSTARKAISLGADVRARTMRPMPIGSRRLPTDIYGDKMEIHSTIMTASMEPLCFAIWQSHYEMVELLLTTDGIDIEVTMGLSLDTYLLMAIKFSTKEIVQLLVSRGNANVNKCNRDGASPLYMAVQRGRTSIVQMLLDAGALLSSATTHKGSRSVLSSAVHGGYEDIIELFIDSGSLDINESIGGTLPLVRAATAGSVTIFRMMLDHGADINMADSRGDTALTAAMRFDHDSIFEFVYKSRPMHLLVGCTAWSDFFSWSCFRGRLEIVKELLQQITDAHQEYVASCSPHWLSLAASAGHICVVKFLLEAGADPNSSSNDHPHPLISAIRGGHKAVVNVLLDYGALNVDLMERNETPLEAAITRHQTVIVQKLLDRGADIEVALRKENTFSNICINGDADILRILLDHGAEAMRYDGRGYMPLHLAARWGRVNVMRTLIRCRCVDIDALDGYGHVALYRAASYGHENAVKLLLVSGASQDVENGCGYTALSAAVRNGHLEVVRDLLLDLDSKGCSINIKNTSDLNMGLWAQERGHFEMSALLYEYFYAKVST